MYFTEDSMVGSKCTTTNWLLRDLQVPAAALEDAPRGAAW